MRWPEGYAWLAVLAVASMVASLFYYLRWLAPAFLQSPASGQPDSPVAAAGWAAAYAAGTASVGLGIAAGAVCRC